MPLVSVVTPSVRLLGLKIVKESLERQSFQDFEWLVASREKPKENCIWVKDSFQGGFWTLNRSYNSLFKKAKGDIIISYQDWIWVPPDAIGKFVDAIKNTNGGIISGVGDQYERLNEFGKPEVKIWSDPRKHLKNGSFYEVYPSDIEWNWAAFLKEYIFEIGGMDENLDFLGFGGDQLQVGERWDALGYKSYLDQSNESYTLRHDRSDFGGQENWDKNHVISSGKYDKHKKELISSGQWPVLNYLKHGRKNSNAKSQ